jgi:type II secretory pathway pseudopilin PulG
MIVVAIIGILAAIAIPRFANLIDRAREARTQGNLGSLRSALAIYYGATDGTWPAAGSLAADLVPTYIDAIPTVLLPSSMTHSETNAETSTAGDDGKWYYDGSGTLNVNCTHTDSKGNAVNTW